MKKQEKNTALELEAFVKEKGVQFGKFVSLIPYTNVVKGLTLTGFKYPLDRYDLKGFCSLGVSNEIIEDTAEIRVKSGIFVLIESRDLPKRSEISEKSNRNTKDSPGVLPWLSFRFCI